MKRTSRVSRNLNRKTFCPFGFPETSNGKHFALLGFPETLTGKHFALSGFPKPQQENILPFRDSRKPFQENILCFRETRKMIRALIGKLYTSENMKMVNLLKLKDGSFYSSTELLMKIKEA